MQRESPPQPDLSLILFKPSGRAALIVSPLVVAAVGLSLYLRYDIIHNTPIGLACEAGEQSLICTVRLDAIHILVRSILGWKATLETLRQLIVQITNPRRIAKTILDLPKNAWPVPVTIFS